MFDLVVAGGLLVDGTGDLPYYGDVALEAGRVATVGPPGTLEGARTIDARGCIVTPGFIDPHTHLDAQLCWDASGDPSIHHGVTSVIIGNCGFGIAPCRLGDEMSLLQSLEAVEEIPFSCTREGVPFSWTSWGEYFAWIGSQALGVNVGGLVPHSALRLAVMGDDALSASVHGHLLAQEVAALETAFEAGALGFSSSRGGNHRDNRGRPMPSLLAGDEELSALVNAASGRVWQINIAAKGMADAVSANAATAEITKYAAWSETSGARLTWTPLVVAPGDRVAWRLVLAHNRTLNERGVVAPQVAPQPMAASISFDGPSFAGMIDGWHGPWAGYGSLADVGRRHRLADPGFRRLLRATDSDCSRVTGACYNRWSLAASPSRPDLVGCTVSEVAETLGAHPIDAMLDLALADRLTTLIHVPLANMDDDAVAELLADPHTLLGLGDAGAHIKSITNYTYPTFLLSRIVRDGRRLELAAAVHGLSAHPASVFGIADRGTLRVGAAADLCVIDMAALRLGGSTVTADLPGGASRLIRRASGYRAVIVNGIPVVIDDIATGKRPGVTLTPTAS